QADELRLLIEGQILRNRDGKGASETGLQAIQSLSGSDTAISDGRADPGARLSAAGVRQRPVEGGTRQPELPVIHNDPQNPSITYAGKCYPVSPDVATAFAAMVEKYPHRVGLSKLIGAHPERKMKSLPAGLKAIVDTNHDGSCIHIAQS